MDVRNPGGGLLAYTASLNAAQIQALHTTPATIVPAAGLSKIIVPIGVVLVYNFGTNTFNASSESDTIMYAGPVTAATTAPVPALIGQTESQFGYVAGNGVGGNPQNTADLVNRALLLTNVADFNLGPIKTSTLGAGGTGYAANDTGTLTHGNGDATYKVLTVGAGGAVLTYQITNPGTNYPVENLSPTARGGAQPGSGSGLTINITAVTLGDGTLKVVTYYQVASVP